MPQTPGESIEKPAAPPPEDPPSRWQRMHAQLHRNRLFSLITKIVVSIIGVIVILAGIVLSGPGVPGPGVVVILVGLAILATEWDWADRWLQALKRKAAQARDKAAAMDPAVRRRRIAWTVAGLVLVLALAAAYIGWRDWPGWSVSMWDRAQSLIGFLPDLPGM